MRLSRTIIACGFLGCSVIGIARAGDNATTTAAVTRSRPLVGAIRWDAWAGDRGPASQAIHRSLGPKKWHYRLPFYAKVRGDEDIEIDGTPQPIMDREIEYAAAAGLDYWAFVTYSADDPLSLALQRYLTSSIRSKIKFCLIVECSRWRQQSFVDRVASMLSEPGYLRVLDNRPLLYLGFIEEKRLKPFNGIEGFRKVLDRFRASLATKGLPKPYIVIMDFHPPQGKKWMDALACDAISSYVAGTGEGEIPYSKLTENIEQFWQRCRDTGAQVVPIVTTGWDPRPRMEKPMPWGNPYGSHNGEADRSKQAQPEEIANQLGSALRWMQEHKDAAQAQAAIIYAWNEFDEGGWLCPTLSEGTTRLDAIGQVLKSPVTSLPAPTSRPNADSSPQRQ
jgi:hypothetical protein